MPDLRHHPFLTFAVALLLASAAAAQQPELSKPLTLPLETIAGTPLRLYITSHVWYRLNEPVTAKLIDAVWSFDRVVIPAGTVAQGRVTTLAPVSSWARFRAILGGDFTPLKKAQVSFTSLTLPDGRSLPIRTASALGLGTFYVPPRPSKSKPSKTSTGTQRGTLKQAASTQLKNQINAHSRGVYNIARGPNKFEMMEDFFFSKLPYHPQWYRTGMRFDSTLSQPLAFGSADIPSANLKALGSVPPPDSFAQIRMNDEITSGAAHVGDPVHAVVSQPLFDVNQRLVLPQGTQVAGKITLVQHARMFHRGGKLRFSIDNLALPIEAANYLAQPATFAPARAQLAAMDRTGAADVKVDEEGTARTTESKTRLLRPIIAGFVAARSLDSDAGRQAEHAGGGNTSGLALGGFSGFGLLGSLASLGPHQIGVALGFYGLAWSVYSNVVARGAEMRFEKDSEMTIRFGSNSRPQ